MKIGLFGINMGPCADPEVAARVAQASEAAGFDSVWAGEHVVLPSPQEPPSPLPPDYPMLDPNVAFAWLAAHTQSLLMGTGIIILPQRNPLVLAKEMASLDVICRGRLVFGVGIGYLRAEFDALGIPFDRKAARTLDYLDAMQAIWSQEVASHDGPFSSFSGVSAKPHPHRAGGPPVVFGGHVAGAFERSVMRASGWYGFALDEDRTRACVDGLAQAAAKHERPAALGPLEISVTPPGAVDLESAQRYAALGVDRLIVLFPPDGSGRLFSANLDEARIVDYVRELGETVVGRV